MKYWQIVGESIEVDGRVVDLMTYDHRNGTWRQDGRDDGECTTFYTEELARAFLKRAAEDADELFRVSIRSFETDDDE